jgi:hypothetical protein
MRDDMNYSASANAFYLSEIHGDSIPTDAVAIIAEEHAALLAGQSLGKIIAPDALGRPRLIDPVPPTEAELLAAWRERTTVSAFQAKAALFNRGLLDAANAAATGAGGLTLLAWNTATEYARLSPAIVALAPAIGITDPEDLDDLFREAAVISA